MWIEGCRTRRSIHEKVVKDYRGSLFEPQYTYYQLLIAPSDESISILIPQGPRTSARSQRTTHSPNSQNSRRDSRTMREARSNPWKIMCWEWSMTLRGAGEWQGAPYLTICASLAYFRSSYNTKRNDSILDTAFDESTDLSPNWCPIKMSSYRAVLLRCIHNSLLCPDAPRMNTPSRTVV
jgi:hypothetical protein